MKSVQVPAILLSKFNDIFQVYYNELEEIVESHLFHTG